MEPKLAPKSIKNWFQEVLNKRVQKWSQKSHARLCDCVRGCASQGVGGSFKSINPESPEGQQRGIGSHPSCTRRHGGGYFFNLIKQRSSSVCQEHTYTMQTEMIRCWFFSFPAIPFYYFAQSLLMYFLDLFRPFKTSWNGPTALKLQLHIAC